MDAEEFSRLITDSIQDHHEDRGLQTPLNIPPPEAYKNCEILMIGSRAELSITPVNTKGLGDFDVLVNKKDESAIFEEEVAKRGLEQICGTTNESSRLFTIERNCCPLGYF